MFQLKVGRVKFLQLAIVGCALAISGSLASAGSNKELRVEGLVTEVNLTIGALTLQTRSGSVIVNTSSATKIERNGRRATLAAFRIGDRAQARFATIPGPATKLEAVGP